MRPVIIGGGLAGGGAAARLAALGARPLLLEREPQAHDKVCGEFLSVEAGRHLAALGVDIARLGGSRIDTMRFHSHRRTAAARLPFVATGVTRRQLDAAAAKHRITVYYPELEFCTDNGAMIALAGALRFQAGTSIKPAGAFAVRPRWPLAELTG